VGKTTVCQAVAELARRRGYRPGGVITPALHDSDGAKVGFEAADVGSGERWPLARTDQELGGPRVGPYTFDPAGLARVLRVLRRAATAGCDLLMVDEIGPLELEQGKGFAPILDLVHWRSSRTVRLGSPEPCSVPAKRETSPVLSPALSPSISLRTGKVEGTIEGFAAPEENSEDSLSGERPMHTLIVVRPALLDQLLLHLRDIECTIFSVTGENRDELPLRIVEELWGDRHCCAVR
jgi:nucleoside-triphosphatase THEP1